MARKGGLGKGLDALFTDSMIGQDAGVTKLKITEIEPNKSQPRKDFDQQALMDLATSIKQHGVVQPLLVRPSDNGRYQIVAGERRWRAARMAGVDELPAVVKELTDSETMEIALVENLQRQDLNAVEEAMGYQDLMSTFGLTQDEVAQRVGKSRPTVTNALRLLHLPGEVLSMIRSGQLSPGHGRSLLGVEDSPWIVNTAKEIVKNGISVRETERLIRKKKADNTPASPKHATDVSRETYYTEMELALKEELGRKVKIAVSGEHGTLSIDFYNKEDLVNLANRLANEK